MTLTMTPPTSSSGSERPECIPRWSTERSPERITIGTAIAEVAVRMGTPLMPWQRHAADVGGELDPDTGLPCYREVIVTVPRQNGKTTLVLGWELQRALGWGGPQRIVYSAQSGNDARKKLVDDQFPILEKRRAKLGIRRCLRGAGNEGVEFLNGSRIALMASAAESGHGPSVDLGVKDELFADVDDRRDQALVPAMNTRASAQILTLSTMGTDESHPLNEAINRGRAAVEAGVRSGIAYFEWSADPDADPDDPATWWSCMPALGHTITEAVVAHARSILPDGEFRRAYLNQRTSAEDRVLPIAKWYAVCKEDVVPASPLTFAIDVNPERSAASIVAASPGEVPRLELIAHDPGTDWLVGRAVALNAKWGATRWCLDQSSPAWSFATELEQRGLVVVPVGAREMVAACGQFYDGVMAARIRLRRHPDLDAAAAGAQKRTSGDAWAWSRKSSSVDISPLVAATLALWGASQPVETAPTTGLVDLNDFLDDDE